MDKEAVLLKAYSILVRNPIKNAHSLMANIEQLCLLSPEAGFQCWRDLLQKNADRIEADIKNNEFTYKSTGYYYINELEYNLVRLDAFLDEPLNIFIKNKELLELLYTKFPINSNTSVYCPIAFLLCNFRLYDAETILSALYKNKFFREYALLWENIVSQFERMIYYYSKGKPLTYIYLQNKEVRSFCISWGNRIADEEEQAGAISQIMKLA